MRKQTRLNFVLLLSVILLASCSKWENEPDPPPPVPYMNINDSLALIEIYQQGDGGHWYAKWDLHDPTTWGGVGIALETSSNEYRVVSLSILLPPHAKGVLSPAVGKLEHLLSLRVKGYGLYGNVPKEIADLKFLMSLEISDTKMTGELPNNLFTEQLEAVLIERNPHIIGKLPSSIVKLRSSPNLNRIFFIRENGLTGDIPEGIKANVALEGNKFTSYPLSLAGKYKLRRYGINAINNRLSGVVPDSILNDTVKLYYFHATTHPQQEGYGYSNWPPTGEIENNYNTYIKNHPDEKE